MEQDKPQPAAWATFYPNGSTASVYSGRLPSHAEPLYRQPPLTDAERYAVMAGLRSLERALYADGENLGGEYRDMQKDAATLRGLLERTKTL